MPSNARRERRRWTQGRMCKRKKSYFWKDEAEQRRAEMKALNVEGADRLEVFNCLYCFGWHVGHRPALK